MGKKSSLLCNYKWLYLLQVSQLFKINIFNFEWSLFHLFLISSQILFLQSKIGFKTMKIYRKRSKHGQGKHQHVSIKKVGHLKNESLDFKEESPVATENETFLRSSIWLLFKNPRFASFLLPRLLKIITILLLKKLKFIKV